MTEKTRLEVLSNLGACVGNYVSHYGKRRAIKAIVPELTYQFLQGLGLITQQLSVSSLHNKDLLINPEGIEITIYRGAQLSEKNKDRLARQAKRLPLPLFLGKGRISKILTDKFPCYNLAADSAFFAWL